jgi:Bacterial pre-peptidase C-terminal domain
MNFPKSNLSENPGDVRTLHFSVLILAGFLFAAVTPSANAFANDPDKNNSRATAQILGTFGRGVHFPSRSSRISGGGDTQDFYRLTLTANLTTANVYLGGLRQNLNLVLLNGVGNQVALSSRTGMSNERISVSLPKGTYYIRVFQGTSGAVSDYRLDLQLSAF